MIEFTIRVEDTSDSRPMTEYRLNPKRAPTELEWSEFSTRVSGLTLYWARAMHQGGTAQQQPDGQRPQNGEQHG